MFYYAYIYLYLKFHVLLISSSHHNTFQHQLVFSKVTFQPTPTRPRTTIWIIINYNYVSICNIMKLLHCIIYNYAIMCLKTSTLIFWRGHSLLIVFPDIVLVIVNLRVLYNQQLHWHSKHKKPVQFGKYELNLAQFLHIILDLKRDWPEMVSLFLFRA